MKRRAFGVAVLVGSATWASGQMLAFQPAGAAIRTLQERNFIPTLNPGNPLQPSGFADPDDGKTGKIPEPEIDNKALKLVKEGKLSQNGDDLTISGGAEFYYHGYHVFANQVEGNLTTNIFTLRGDVKLIGKDAIVSGDQVSVDFERKVYHAFGSSADMKPSLVQGAFLKDLYSHGRESYGSANETKTLDGGITSCDLPKPHYELDAESIIVRPRKRVIFRKLKVKLLGHTILKLPYLSLPLDDRSYNNMPVVGQSPDEGYYIKFRYGIPVKGDDFLAVHVDLMSQLGLGLGADYGYRTKVSNGTMQVYRIFGPGDMLKVINEHQQTFKWGTLLIDNDYEDNNYLVNPGSTSENTKLLLTLPQKGSALTKITLNRTASQTMGYDTETDDFAVSDQRKFGKNISTSIDVDYQKSSSTFQGADGPMTSTQEDLAVKFDGQDDLKKATAELTYQRTIPIGTTQAILGGNDQTPVLTLSSDSTRLMSQKMSDAFPFKTYFSIGQFSDQFDGGQISRDAFDFTFARTDKSRGPFHSDFSGEFKQGIYSDGTAEYVLNLADQESYRLGKDTSLNFHYNYLRPYGYSPLSIDQTGQTNLATADLSVRPFKSFLIGAQSGFDLLRLQTSDVAWQPLGVRMEFSPEKYFMLRSQATYDTFQGAWSNIRVDMSYKPGATFLSVGAYYDGIQHTWSNINVFLDSLKMGRLKLSAILTYDGYDNTFDTQQYSFTYDLHCAEAVFTIMDQETGFRPGRTYQFFIRLKALPFDSPFGAGSRGQPLGTGTGTSF